MPTLTTQMKHGQMRWKKSESRPTNLKYKMLK